MDIWKSQEKNILLYSKRSVEDSLNKKEKVRVEGEAYMMSLMNLLWIAALSSRFFQFTKGPFTSTVNVVVYGELFAKVLFNLVGKLSVDLQCSFSVLLSQVVHAVEGFLCFLIEFIFLLKST